MKTVEFKIRQFKKNLIDIHPRHDEFRKYYSETFLKNMKRSEEEGTYIEIKLKGSTTYMDMHKQYLEEFMKIKFIPLRLRKRIVSANKFGLILVNLYNDDSVKIIKGKDIFLYKVL